MFQMPVEKITAYKELFDLIDTDKDGKISLKDIEKIVKKAGITMTVNELEELMRYMDYKNEGCIGFDEMLRVFEKKLIEPDMFEDLYEAFRVLDYDFKGTLTRKELESVMLNFGEKMTQEEVNDMISFAPFKNDEIDYRNFAKYLSEKIEQKIESEGSIDKKTMSRANESANVTISNDQGIFPNVDDGIKALK